MEAAVGQLIPEDFPMDLLRNDAERVVVEALRRTLYSDWLVIPDIGFRGTTKDHQTDIILIHPDMGIVVVEVKGHRLSIRDGVWYGQEGTPLNPQPVDQAKNNAFYLRNLLRRKIDSLSHLEIVYGIAFPNTRSIEGEIPPDLVRDQLLLAEALEDTDRFVEKLVHTQRSWNVSLGPEQINGIIELLCPDAEFRWDPESRVKHTRERLKDLCNAQISSLTSLLSNRRVIVRGGAGTGKTFLGGRWATQAWLEGDQVLFTCYNDPLAGSVREEFGHSFGENVTIGPFIRLALSLQGMPPLEIPENASQEWWDTQAIGHIMSNWPKVGEFFDTIIVDEAQDFSPAWIALLESLLDPDGRRRMLLLADEGQGIYEKGFVFPQADDGWVHVELQSNFRNARPIARVLRRGLGGAPSPLYSPEGLGVQFHPATDIENLAAVVEAELERILEDEERSAAGVCVATLHSSVRDALRTRLELVRWEDRGDGAVVCENVHRLKGLEFDSVILVGMDPADADLTTLLYIGVSRAVSELIVVGSREVADRLGLA
jgi:hypothetical protein